MSEGYHIKKTEVPNLGRLMVSKKLPSLTINVGLIRSDLDATRINQLLMKEAKLK